jgi:hypothetical protein
MRQFPPSGPFFLDFPAERQATRKRNHANWPLDQPRDANTHQHFSDIQIKKIGHKINPSGETNYNFVW